MSHRLERMLAAPVACQTCGWIGRTGALRSRAGETAPGGMVPLRCPECMSAEVKNVEHDAPEMIQ